MTPRRPSRLAPFLQHRRSRYCDFGIVGTYTFLKIAGHPDELFDRVADPDQLRNVAGNTENKSVVARLEKKLQATIKAVDIAIDELPGDKDKDKHPKRKKRDG